MRSLAQFKLQVKRDGVLRKRGFASTAKCKPVDESFSRRLDKVTTQIKSYDALVTDIRLSKSGYGARILRKNLYREVLSRRMCVPRVGAIFKDALRVVKMTYPGYSGSEALSFAISCLGCDFESLVELYNRLSKDTVSSFKDVCCRIARVYNYHNISIQEMPKAVYKFWRMNKCSMTRRDIADYLYSAKKSINLFGDIMAVIYAKYKDLVSYSEELQLKIKEMTKNLLSMNQDVVEQSLEELPALISKMQDEARAKWFSTYTSVF